MAVKAQGGDVAVDAHAFRLLEKAAQVAGREVEGLAERGQRKIVGVMVFDIYGALPGQREALQSGATIGRPL